MRSPRDRPGLAAEATAEAVDGSGPGGTISDGNSDRVDLAAWNELAAGEDTMIGFARVARAIHKTRTRRVRYFPESALGDAAWDILLALFADTVEGRPASTKSVSISGGLAVSTCLAVLDRLANDGMIVRRRDEHDRRVTRVVMTPAGLLTMRDYLRDEVITAGR